MGDLGVDGVWLSPIYRSPPMAFEYLNEFRDHLSWRQGDALILAEANAEREELVEYFGDGDRLPMLFNFLLNQRLFLALARGASPAPASGPRSCATTTRSTLEG